LIQKNLSLEQNSLFVKLSICVAVVGIELPQRRVVLTQAYILVLH